MSKEPMRGVTPVGGPRDEDVPREGPVIVFTGAHLRCPCRPGELQEIADFHGRSSVLCCFCGNDYALPQVSYRWPPVPVRRRA